MNKFKQWIIAFILTVTILVASTIIYEVTDNDDVKSTISFIIAPLIGAFMIFLIGIGRD